MLRLYVCLVVATTFMLGGIMGALLFERMQERALLIPAALTGVCGLGYGIYRQYRLAKCFVTDHPKRPDESASAP